MKKLISNSKKCYKENKIRWPEGKWPWDYTYSGWVVRENLDKEVTFILRHEWHRTSRGRAYSRVTQPWRHWHFGQDGSFGLLSCHCKVFSSISGCHPPVAATSPSPHLCPPKCLQTLPNGPWGLKLCLGAMELEWRFTDTIKLKVSDVQKQGQEMFSTLAPSVWQNYFL